MHVRWHCASSEGMMVNKTDIAPASREFIHNDRYTKQDTETETKPILSCEEVPDGLPALQGEGLYPASGSAVHS